MIGGKGRVVWNHAQNWWDHEEPRITFGEFVPVWVRYLIIIPIDYIPLTTEEEIKVKYR